MLFHLWNDQFRWFLNEIVFTKETERNTVPKTILVIACSLLISSFRSRQRNDKRFLPLDVRLYVQYTSSFLCLCIDPAYRIKLQLWCVIVMVQNHHFSTAKYVYRSPFANHELHDISSRRIAISISFADDENFLCSPHPSLIRVAKRVR